MSSINSFIEDLRTSEKKTRVCIVPVCAGERFDLVHKFPNDPKRAELWKKILDVPILKNLPIDTIRKRYFVCTRHFRPNDYKNIVSRGLNKTALPSINLKALDNLDIIDRNFPEKKSIAPPILVVEPPPKIQYMVFEEEYLEDSANTNSSITLIDPSTGKYSFLFSCAYINVVILRHNM